MRKLSKPAIAITLGVLILAVILSVAVGRLMKNTSKKTNISQIDVNEAGIMQKNAGQTSGQKEEPDAAKEPKNAESTIGDAIMKERQMLKESDKGGYVGGVGVSKRKKGKNSLENEFVGEEPDEDPLDPSIPGDREKQSIYNRPVHQDGRNRNTREGDNEQARRKTWEYLYSQKSFGGFLNKPQQATQGGKDQGSEGTEKETDRKDGPRVMYYKPYRAVVDRTFTSAQTNAVFVATGTGHPVKGWKVVGRAAANFKDNRFHVEVSGVIDPDNTHHQMKGYVASIDESDGIVSAVRHEDVAGTITGGVMSGVSSFLNALRKDTTTVEVGAGGVTVTGQTKNENRLREGGLAAGDTIFQGLSKKIEGEAKKTPTLIMEKGVPVLVYFTP